MHITYMRLSWINVYRFLLLSSMASFLKHLSLTEKKNQTKILTGTKKSISWSLYIWYIKSDHVIKYQSPCSLSCLGLGLCLTNFKKGQTFTSNITRTFHNDILNVLMWNPSPVYHTWHSTMSTSLQLTTMSLLIRWNAYLCI